MRILYTEHKTNEKVKRIIELEVGKIVSLLEMVRKRKLQWFFHVVRQSGDSFAKITMEGMVDGIRSRGRLEKSCLINITEWTGPKVAEWIKKPRDREVLKNVVEKIAVVPPRPEVKLSPWLDASSWW